MPADIVNAKNFKLTTDFSLDKIIYLYEGSLNVPNNAFADATIPHGLPFTPLSLLVYSLTPDFAISYMSGSGPAPTDPFAYQLGVDVLVTSRPTENYIAVSNFFATPITVYYRLYSFEPSTSNADIPFTANSSDPFILNTDYNYTKLYMEGVIDLSVTTFVNHNLGYIPQNEVWLEFATITQAPQSSYSLVDASLGGIFGSRGVVVTNNQIQVVGTIPGALKLHYRIYLDQ